MADQVGAVRVDKLLQGALDAAVFAIIDVQDERQLAESDQVQVVGIITEEELFVAEQFAENLEVILAELFDFFGSVTFKAGSVDLLHSLAEHGVLEAKVQETGGHFGTHHGLQIEMVAFEGVVGVLHSPVHDGPAMAAEENIS